MNEKDNNKKPTFTSSLINSQYISKNKGSIFFFFFFKAENTQIYTQNTYRLRE